MRKKAASQLVASDRVILDGSIWEVWDVRPDKERHHVRVYFIGRPSWVLFKEGRLLTLF